MTQPRLLGSYQPISIVSEADLHSLFDLFRRHYNLVTFDQFKTDFFEKDYVILLRDEEHDVVRGFSTLVLYDRVVLDEPFKLLFSGDTVIDQDYWGQQALSKTWCSLAGKIKAEYPDTRLYWLLITKGHRTYLYLPLFFHEFYPRYNQPAPRFDQEVIHDFGRFKYGKNYDPVRGIISFEIPHGQLRDDLAEIPASQFKNPHIRFFLEKNKNYRNGDELICLARLDADNMRFLAKTHFLMGRESPTYQPA